MAGSIVQLSDANWEAEVTQSAVPVLVDFWAEWCGPCRMIAPTLEALATELTGKLKIGKVNVDENQALASKFGIRSIPTLLVFKGGTVQAQMVGAMSRAALLAKLAPSL